ncbi:MAG: hypothetical protein JKY88_17760 [Pseudomonadales bacterium]|nr:hypothetical protein [Pseudomonadales bacterium]
MNIFSKRDKNGRFQSDKESESTVEDNPKTASAPSEAVTTDDSTTVPETKMDKARIVFQEMFGKYGIARKDIIQAFQSDRVKLTKAGAGTYYAKLKREHLDNLGSK